MDNMFNGCVYFEYLDLSNFNTENVDVMNNIFWMLITKRNKSEI